MPKLFIPGPTEVYPELLAAQTNSMIAHRGKGYADLHEGIEKKLQQTMFTQNRVFIATCSATGMIEAALRNAVKNKVLVCANGFFAAKWDTVAKQCGIDSTTLDYELGEAVKAEDVEKRLNEDSTIDAVMLTHSETSTGVLSPLKEIAAVVKKFPNVVLLVDTVSSFAAAEIRVDEWGIDLILFGMQKALALPPGLAFASVSPEIMQRSENQPMGRKGHYFDFMVWEKVATKFNTAITPAISLLFALDKQLDNIIATGMEKRWEKHLAMQKLTQDWVEKHGLSYFSEEGFHSPGVSVINNDKDWDIGEINKQLEEKYNMVIANGYKELKGKCFRIGHMGDHTSEAIEELLGNLDKIIETL
jgi:aspartate aminotransferase-like enzyme